MKVLSAVVLTLLVFSLSQAQQRWERIYGGGNNDDYAYFVQQTSDGGYIVTGSTFSFASHGFWDDVWLIKMDASGDTLWTKTYGGPYPDVGYCVRQTSDGGYIIAGGTMSFGAGDSDFYLIKTKANGDTLWTRTYGGPDMDDAYSVQQTSDGGYIVAGKTMSFGAGNADVWLIKTNVAGDTLWTRTYGGTGYDLGRSVQQTSDGGYIVAGFTNSFGAGGGDVYLIKTKADGDTLWTRTYGGTNYDEGRSVQQTSDGGYIVTGYTASFGAGSYDVYLIKTKADGDTLWTRTYGTPNDEFGYSTQQTSDGGYIIAGYKCRIYGDSNDVYLVKTNASGDTLWTRTYGGPDDDYGYSVQQTSDGGYIIAGISNSFSRDCGAYLIKTDGNGNVGVEERGQGLGLRVAKGLTATPNPFASFARIAGHEGERFALYDIAGRRMGTYRGDRIGEGLSPGVYFLKPEGRDAKPLRVVKVR
jgi:hypothetical protein